MTDTSNQQLGPGKSSPLNFSVRFEATDDTFRAMMDYDAMDVRLQAKVEDAQREYSINVEDTVDLSDVQAELDEQ